MQQITVLYDQKQHFQCKIRWMIKVVWNHSFPAFRLLHPIAVPETIEASLKSGPSNDTFDLVTVDDLEAVSLVDVGGMWIQNDQPNMERLGKNQKTAWFIGSNTQIWFLGHGLVALTPKNLSMCPFSSWSRWIPGSTLHDLSLMMPRTLFSFFEKKQLVMLIILHNFVNCYLSWI